MANGGGRPRPSMRSEARQAFVYGGTSLLVLDSSSREAAQE